MRGVKHWQGANKASDPSDSPTHRHLLASLAALVEVRHNLVRGDDVALAALGESAALEAPVRQKGVSRVLQLACTEMGGEGQRQVSVSDKKA